MSGRTPDGTLIILDFTPNNSNKLTNFLRSRIQEPNHDNSGLPKPKSNRTLINNLLSTRSKSLGEIYNYTII